MASCKFSMEKEVQGCTFCKVMAAIFWDMEGVILVDIITKETTSNSEAYVQTLQKLHAHLGCV
jgi:hypothetical protein